MLRYALFVLVVLSLLLGQNFIYGYDFLSHSCGASGKARSSALVSVINDSEATKIYMEAGIEYHKDDISMEDAVRLFMDKVKK